MSKNPTALGDTKLKLAKANTDLARAAAAMLQKVYNNKDSHEWSRIGGEALKRAEDILKGEN